MMTVPLTVATPQRRRVRLDLGVRGWSISLLHRIAETAVAHQEEVALPRRAHRDVVPEPRMATPSEPMP